MVIILLCGLLLAQEIILTLDADRLAVGQVTNLSIDFVNIDDAKAPHFPKGSGLSVELKNPNPARSFVYQNGTSEHTLRYQYTVLGMTEGEWRIGPVSLNHKGRSIVSNMLMVDVFRSGVDVKERGSVEGIISKETPYAGEIISYHVRFSLRESGIQQRLIPSEYVGISALSGIPPQQKQSRIWEGTDLVEVTDVWFPLRMGRVDRYEITPTKVMVEYLEKEDLDVPTLFFQPQRKQKYFVGSEILGLIRPLPVAPVDFSGLVGQFQFRVYPRTRVVQIDEPIELVVDIWGDGVLSGYRLPPFVDENFEVFDERPSIEESFIEGVYKAKWNMNRTLLPISAGKHVIQPFSIQVFDPQQEKYIRLQSDPVVVHVQGVLKERTEKEEKEQSVDAPLWVEELPERRSMSLPPWWLTWSLAIIPIFLIWRRREHTEKVPQYPRELPEDTEERLSVLEHSLSDFVYYCSKNQVSYSEEKVQRAQEILYVSRYGGGEVGEVELLVQEAMVLS